MNAMTFFILLGGVFLSSVAVAVVFLYPNRIIKIMIGSVFSIVYGGGIICSFLEHSERWKLWLAVMCGALLGGIVLWGAVQVSEFFKSHNTFDEL